MAAELIDKCEKCGAFFCSDGDGHACYEPKRYEPEEECEG
jgi:hypothetical protein